MDGDLVQLVLLVLTLATALNLFLTLRLAARLRGGAAAAEPLTVALGVRLPQVAALNLPESAPAVIVFLSTGCPACRTKVAELSAILPGMARAGVTLRIAGIGDIAELIAGTPLPRHLVELEEEALDALNPRRAAPAYIFTDAEGVALASDFLGDENWRSFAAQMLETGG
jgi:hypothetical protein